MSFPNSIIDDPVFDEFFSSVANVTGKRRETGAAASRVLAISVPCFVTGGDNSTAQSSASARPPSVDYSVMIRRAVWPDHLPPQIGDVVKIDDYQDMIVSEVSRADPAAWTLNCRTAKVPL